MGCDVFGFISGSAPAKFQLFDDGQVAAAGAMLGPFHDASRGSSLAGAARRGKSGVPLAPCVTSQNLIAQA